MWSIAVTEILAELKHFRIQVYGYALYIVLICRQIVLICHRIQLELRIVSTWRMRAGLSTNPSKAKVPLTRKCKGDYLRTIRLHNILGNYTRLGKRTLRT